MSSFVLCVGCGTPLYGFLPCQWRTCEQCGVDVRDGICPLCNSRNSCVHDSDPNSFDYPPDSYNHPHPTYETYSGHVETILNVVMIVRLITPSEPIDSLSMGDEHFDTILVTKSDEFIKSCVENLVPNPSESEGENVCNVPSCFTTFSNILFDDEYEFDSVDDQSLHNDDFSKKIFSNLLFEEEISSIKKNHHHFNAESDLVESMLNHDSSIVSSSSKIDSLLDEFAGELTLLRSIPPGIDETDYHPENEIRLSQRLLYDNSSPRPLEEFNSENSNVEIESFSPFPIPNEDSDYFMEEIDLFLTPGNPMPPSIKDDEDSEGDILFL
nr:pre-mRNA splicing Prp18-interacting factor [Tanacetum cinerariifolium]